MNPQLISQDDVRHSDSDGHVIVVPSGTYAISRADAAAMVAQGFALGKDVYANIDTGTNKMTSWFVLNPAT